MNRRRDLLIGLAAGAVALAFSGAVFYGLSRQSTAAGGVEGVIVARRLEAAPETQITVGRAGVHRREFPGTCQFTVRSSAGRLYTVTVDPATYAAHPVGGKFYFVPAAP